ncbi:hypothetical protein H0I76_19105 [Limibaculum sp. M0105]|uniref:Uncharacterized protein n=1 Tax=Thermohalobaculum xanthum TaxID=2753746 RepID=A0A8J7SFJ3_9RHOB|nr:hypothetical protein [Thermohalobaculum xanthum]MBK0401312.1 hypothetical protein [Thermohalobaculum xanthum]
MTPRAQKRLALAGMALVIAVFIGANLHLVTAAVQSQPGCVLVEGAAMPARYAC